MEVQRGSDGRPKTDGRPSEIGLQSDVIRIPYDFRMSQGVHKTSDGIAGKRVASFDGVSRPASFTDLRQVVLFGQFFQMDLDRVAIGTCGIFDFLDGDLAARFHKLQNLTR